MDTYNVYISDVPLYKNTYRYARLNLETTDYLRSKSEDEKCARSIENALSNGFNVSMRDFIIGWGRERISWILANTILTSDGFSDKLRQWAESVPHPVEEAVGRAVNTENIKGVEEMANWVSWFDAEINAEFCAANERRVNDAFKVLSSIRINDNLEIVMGSRTTQYGTDYATWECSGGDSYYWGHYDFRTEQAAKLDMCERAAEKFRGMTAEIDTLRENSCVNFSVVNVNGDEYLSGNHIMDINIRDDPDFLELVEDSNADTFRISVDYYCWGDRPGEASPASSEQLKAIHDNWDTEINKATLIESHSFSVDINEEEEDSCEIE